MYWVRQRKWHHACSRRGNIFILRAMYEQESPLRKQVTFSVSWNHFLLLCIIFIRLCGMSFKQLISPTGLYDQSYVSYRMGKIRSLPWSTGAVLPEKIRQDTLSARENDYFSAYNNCLSEYCDDIELDLNSDMEVIHYILVNRNWNIMGCKLTDWRWNCESQTPYDSNQYKYAFTLI